MFIFKRVHHSVASDGSTGLRMLCLASQNRLDGVRLYRMQQQICVTLDFMYSKPTKRVLSTNIYFKYIKHFFSIKFGTKFCKLITFEANYPLITFRACVTI